MRRIASTRQPLHPAKLLTGAVLAVACAATCAQSLLLAPEDTPNVWRPTSASNAFAGLSLARARPTPGSPHLFNDYYFYDTAHGTLGPMLGGLLGGLRARGGVAGQPAPLSLFDNLPESSQNLPYLGLGYSHLWLNNTLSLNADLGLASQSPWTSARLHGQASGTPTLDDVTRDLRWAPVMSVNLSYSF